jgi:hypothetical protein
MPAERGARPAQGPDSLAVRDPDSRAKQDLERDVIAGAYREVGPETVYAEIGNALDLRLVD